MPQSFTLGQAYSVLRDKPVWRLFTANNAPWVVGLLQATLFERERALSLGQLAERLDRELDSLATNALEVYSYFADHGGRGLVRNWIAAGWLVARFPEGAREEEVELSKDALTVIRFLGEVDRPQTTATQSRLGNIIAAAKDLAIATDSSMERRLRSLMEERARIDREIDKVASGRIETLPDSLAIEGARNILSLVEGIPQDFQRVRARFEAMNKEIRRALAESAGVAKSPILEDVFAQRDVLGQTPEGKTLRAFWEVLKDQDLRDGPMEAVTSILSRPFAATLTPQERAKLDRLVDDMVEGVEIVHKVQRDLSYSLRVFVSSKAFLQDMAMTKHLSEASAMARELTERYGPGRRLDFKLVTTTGQVSSLAQWSLRAPRAPYQADGRFAAHENVLDPETAAGLQHLVRSAEVNLTALRETVLELLKTHSQLSVAQVLQQVSADRGLATVVGYLTLAAKHGIRPPQEAQQWEQVSWETRPNAQGESWIVGATIPRLFFIEGDLHG